MTGTSAAVEIYAVCPYSRCGTINPTTFTAPIRQVGVMFKSVTCTGCKRTFKAKLQVSSTSERIEALPPQGEL